MKARDTVFLLVAIALVGALGLALWDSSESEPGIVDLGADPLPVAESPADDPPPAPVEVARVTRPLMTAEPPVENLDLRAAPGQTHGAIRGHISLSSAVIGKLNHINVRVREAVNILPDGGNDHVPFQKTFKAEIIPGLGTPEFHYDGIPFSDYGYVVRAFAPGFNGSEMFVRLDADHKIADVVLSVTSGIPFSVILRDQLRLPVAREQVFMIPVGQPTGRQNLQKEADGYGVAVFESVLEGKYEVRVGAVNQPHTEPVEVTVIAIGGERSVTIEVPYGHDLEVLVQAVAGWGIENAELMMYATDTPKWRKYEGTTDFSGKFTFVHMPPGQYQLNVTADGFEHWGRTVKVPEGSPPPQTVVQMVPRR